MAIFNRQFLNEIGVLSSSDVRKLLDIYNKFIKYKYIMINSETGKVTTSQKLHKTLSRVDFNKYGGGICYDYVNAMISKIPFTCKSFFSCWLDKDNNPVNTHTYILVYISDKVYWIECSWKSHSGIRRFENEDDAISYITNLYKGNNYTVKYIPNNKLVGITIDEFIEEMSKLPEYNFKYNRNPKCNYIDRRQI